MRCVRVSQLTASRRSLLRRMSFSKRDEHFATVKSDSEPANKCAPSLDAGEKHHCDVRDVSNADPGLPDLLVC